MPDIREEAKAYFKENPAFSRCFHVMKKKWESYGRSAGIISLAECSNNEKYALEGFLGRSFHGENISFSMKEFEAALRETRFRELTLLELLELYFGSTLQTNQLRKQQKEEEKIAFFQSVLMRFQELADDEAGKTACDWMRAAYAEKQYGYSIMQKTWSRSPECAEKEILAAGKAIRKLQALQVSNARSGELQPVPLAVLAADVTGNPHFFDRGSSAGQLLTCALCWVSSSYYPVNARELAELYVQNGIQMDDLSSSVTAFGIHLEKQGKLHPAYEGFCEEKEPAVISLRNLEQITGAYGESKRIYIVENEMVFSYLCQKCTELPVTILCTSGQPRTAAWKLLDLLSKEEVKLFYAGDLDPEGMDIADRIWRRYPEKVEIWRMGSADYLNSISEEKIDSRRLSLLNRLEHPVLKETAKLLQKHKKAGYQESLLEDMEKDIAFPPSESYNGSIL